MDANSGFDVASFDPFELLTEDVLIYLALNFLTAKDLARMTQVNNSWRNKIHNQDKFWQVILRRDFSYMMPTKNDLSAWKIWQQVQSHRGVYESLVKKSLTTLYNPSATLILVARRCRQELKEFATNPPEGLELLELVDDDCTKWRVKMFGLKPPYANATFKILVTIPKEYPFKPICLTFQTKVLHINISPIKGQLCCALCQLKDEWSPALTVSKILVLLQNLMETPSIEGCVFHHDILALYKEKQRTIYRKSSRMDR